LWNDRLRFAERVEHDWRALSAEEQATALQALERIDEDPIIGAPLFEPLRGYWSYRAGHLRIVYRLAPEARFVVVLSIGRAAPS
jgi:mRNA-degrading endonuclease RelE of RelBE toxin-antitoxin system